MIDAATLSQTGKTRDDRFVAFVRHGHWARRSGIYPNDYQDGLTEQGFNEARAAANALAQFRPSRIVASPFLRTKQTANEFVRFFGIPVEYDERIRERSFETFYDTSLREIELSHGSDFLHTLLHSSENIVLPGSEPFSSAMERVSTALEEMVSGDAGNIIVVSHGGPHSWLCCRLLHIPAEHLRTFHLGTGRFSLFRFSGGSTFSRLDGLNLNSLP